MNTRHVIAVFSALIVIPLVLGLGVFLLIPVALVLLPALAIAGVAVLPALFSSAASAGAPTGVAEPAPVAVTA